ncbi:universal stress protein [Mesorhizobium sp. SB112]|uniref:universal stress protein n=1 Tax=Mesorhizobium sp. SB112 TaxID=3151853 RepID=UPI0032647232
MSTPKDIVTYLEADAVDAFEAALTTCTALAAAWQTHLNIAFVPQNIGYLRHAGFVRGGAIADMDASVAERNAAALDRLRGLLKHLRTQYDFSVEVRDCVDESGEPLMLHARHSSLAVLVSDRSVERPTSALSLSEDVIFASGRPTLLLPKQWSGELLSRKVVLGWNGSREAARAIADAMPFLQAASAVHLVVVPEPKIMRLLGQEPGADISHHLARNGVAVTLHRLEAEDAGAALLDHASTVGANMIVMGAYGQSRVSEFVFGSATCTILDQVERPILFSR